MYHYSFEYNKYKLINFKINIEFDSCTKLINGGVMYGIGRKVLGWIKYILYYNTYLQKEIKK